MWPFCVMSQLTPIDVDPNPTIRIPIDRIQGRYFRWTAEATS
jgi:hypothetical protein